MTRAGRIMVPVAFSRGIWAKLCQLCFGVDHALPVARCARMGTAGHASGCSRNRFTVNS